LPAEQGGLLSPGFIVVFALGTLLVGGALAVTVLWFRGIRGLPLFARTYARVVRLASWCGLGPHRSQTPYEYTRDLARAVPAAATPLNTIADAYVAGAYGGLTADAPAAALLRASGEEAQQLL